MTKVDRIKDEAYMILGGLAFVFGFDTMRTITVYNLKDLRKKVVFCILDGGVFRPRNINCSELMLYKSLAMLERNKEILLRGYADWANTQKKK